MGSAASFELGGGTVPAATPFFCHACSDTFILSENTRRTELCCPRCNSQCLEEFSNERRWMVGGSYFPRFGRPYHGLNFSENLTYEQSRRLLNASIMLRLLEAQLREELDSLQMAYTASLAHEAAEKAKGLSAVMLSKLRRPKADVDMICSQPCCPVCNDDFVVDHECLQMPCSHIFHEECVFPWLQSKRTCPICRYELNDTCLTLEELQKYSREELMEMIKKQTFCKPSEQSDSAVVAEEPSQLELATQLHALLLKEHSKPQPQPSHATAAVAMADNNTSSSLWSHADLTQSNRADYMTPDSLTRHIMQLEDDDTYTPGGGNDAHSSANDDDLSLDHRWYPHNSAQLLQQLHQDLTMGVRNQQQQRQASNRFTLFPSTAAVMLGGTGGSEADSDLD